MSKTPAMNEVVAYYDREWRKRGRNVSTDMAERRFFILSEIAALGQANLRILDFGCGTGWLSADMARLGTVTGIDLSPEGVAFAKTICPTGTFVAGSLFDYRFTPESFDVVVSQEVIEHVNEQREYLRLAWEYLVPGGHLILTTPNLAGEWALGLTLEQMERRGWLQPIENWLSDADLRRLAKGLFRIKKQGCFYYPKDWRRQVEGVILSSSRLQRLARRCRLYGGLAWLRRAVVSRSILGRIGLYQGMVAQKMGPIPPQQENR